MEWVGFAVGVDVVQWTASVWWWLDVLCVYAHTHVEMWQGLYLQFVWASDFMNDELKMSVTVLSQT